MAGPVDRSIYRLLDQQIAASVDRWIGTAMDP